PGVQREARPVDGAGRAGDEVADPEADRTGLDRAADSRRDGPELWAWRSLYACEARVRPTRMGAAARRGVGRRDRARAWRASLVARARRACASGFRPRPGDRAPHRRGARAVR